MSCHCFQIEREALLLTPQDSDQLRIAHEALSFPIKKQWKNEMEEEMDSVKVDQVWRLVDLPPGCKTIGNKWILKIKHKVDGTTERYKAHLVAKCYT